MQMYLAQMDLLREKSVHSEVLEAVRQATPESRAAFEQRFGSIAMTCHVIASGEKGAWAKEYKLLEDGTVEETFYEGGSEEAEVIRLGAQQQAGQ
jgi:hypothetical protein